MIFTDLLSKEWVRLVGVLLVGITIGVVFYPTKRIEEKLKTTHQEEITKLNETHAAEQHDLMERYTSSLKETKQVKEESQHTIASLTTQVKTLQSKQKTSTYKLVKPDGTIEERTFSESEVNESSKVVTKIQEEFKTKIEQIETKYATIHAERVQAIKTQFDSKEAEYKKTIDTLEKSKTVSINEKRFGIEAGLTNEKNYYGHATMDVWGPTFIGVHGQVGPQNNSNNLGVGLGLRF